MFHTQTRIGEDKCGMSQESIQNVSSANYMLNNYYMQDCTMRKPIEFATTYKNMNFSAAGGMGNQCGIGGCNIDSNSDLLIGSVQTHPRCRISLLQRPFVTVPYLGRGPSNPVLESQLQQCDSVGNRKSTNTLSEVSYMPLTNYPLLPAIKDAITNPKFSVEGVAQAGWVRGGVPSRAMKECTQ